MSAWRTLGLLAIGVDAGLGCVKRVPADSSVVWMAKAGKPRCAAKKLLFVAEALAETGRAPSGAGEPFDDVVFKPTAASCFVGVRSAAGRHGCSLVANYSFVLRKPTFKKGSSCINI